MTTKEALTQVLGEMNSGAFAASFEPGRKDAELRLGSAVMKRLLTVSPTAWNAVCDAAERCTFNRRRYGSMTYTWAFLDGEELSGDPWPATRFPKTAMCLSIMQGWVAGDCVPT